MSVWFICVIGFKTQSLRSHGPPLTIADWLIKGPTRRGNSSLLSVGTENLKRQEIKHQNSLLALRLLILWPLGLATLNLLLCADSSTNTKQKGKVIFYKQNVMCNMHGSVVMCLVSGVRCRMWRINCHLSIMPTVTATDPPPANSPIMHSRLVPKDPKKNQRKKGRRKISRCMSIETIRSLTRSLQSTRKRAYWDGTHTHMTDGHSNVETESDQWADLVKINDIFVCFWTCFTKKEGKKAV